MDEPVAEGKPEAHRQRRRRTECGTPPYCRLQQDWRPGDQMNKRVQPSEPRKPVQTKKIAVSTQASNESGLSEMIEINRKRQEYFS